MTSPSATRLERALELFLDHQRRGGDWQRLLSDHPELAEVLDSFLAEPRGDPAGSVAFCPEDFELVREIGRGGAGVVHEARQRSLGRNVALKLLHEPFAGSPTALARFRREAQILARLDHPGIVRVFAVGEERGRHWLAMELVPGESLATHIDALRRRGGHHGDSLRRLVETTAEIASALQHAHEAGIVHRDVKPSNILLRRDGSAVLGDFGLARDADAPSLTHSGIATGTPHYMAPEQVFGATASCDARTDVFGLGATLYECLTLKRAFDGDSIQAVLQSVLNTDPVDPRRLQRGLPADLAAIVCKALEKDPAHRYATARHFADDLRAFLELRPIAARPPSASRRVVRLVRRRPLLIATLLLVGGGLLTGGLWLWQLPYLHAAAAARLDEAFENEMVAGMLARTGSNADECYHHFQRAIEIAPDRLEAQAGRCIALAGFAGPQAALDYLDQHVGAGQLPAELGHCRAYLLGHLKRTDEAAALEQRLGQPTTAMDMFMAAWPLLGDQDDMESVRRADQLLSLAVRIAPRPRLLLHAQWATVQVLLGDHGQCREAADALLSLWPDNVLALQTAGVILMKVDPARALSVLKRAEAIGPVNGLLSMNLGVAQFLNQRRDDALATLAEAMPATDLTDAQRWRILELVHQMQGEQLEGELADAWFARSPGNLFARRAAARHALREGDTERSIGMFRACVAERPEFEVRMDLAFALSVADELPEACELVRSLVHERPQLDRAHELLLDVLDQLHDAHGALAEGERWAAANPGDAKAWQALAAACLQSSDGDANERALAAGERADYLTAGNDPTILDLRATALERLGRAEEAQHVRARAVAASNRAR